MKVNTGFGYFLKDGKITDKYHFPIGEHPDPIGYEFVEVADKEACDLIEVWKPTPSIMDAFSADQLYADVNSRFQAIGTQDALAAAFYLSSCVGIKDAMNYRFENGTRNFSLAKQFLLFIKDTLHQITDAHFQIVKEELFRQGINLDDF